MRKIKFRGEDLTGTMRYGDLIQYHNGVCIKHWMGSISPEYTVKPESVAQFVGYDADGREVYEGDVVVDDGGEEYTQVLPDETIYCRRKNLRLKED